MKSLYLAFAYSLIVNFGFCAWKEPEYSREQNAKHTKMFEDFLAKNPGAYVQSFSVDNSNKQYSEKWGYVTLMHSNRLEFMRDWVGGARLRIRLTNSYPDDYWKAAAMKVSYRAWYPKDAYNGAEREAVSSLWGVQDGYAIPTIRTEVLPKFRIEKMKDDGSRGWSALLDVPAFRAYEPKWDFQVAMVRDPKFDTSYVKFGKEPPTTNTSGATPATNVLPDKTSRTREWTALWNDSSNPGKGIAARVISSDVAVNGVVSFQLEYRNSNASSARVKVSVSGDDNFGAPWEVHYEVGLKAGETASRIHSSRTAPTVKFIGVHSEK